MFLSEKAAEDAHSMAFRGGVRAAFTFLFLCLRDPFKVHCNRLFSKVGLGRHSVRSHLRKEYTTKQEPMMQFMSSCRRYQASTLCLPQYSQLFGEERIQALTHASKASIGVSCVRLLPKKSGLRAIANLSKRRRSRDSYVSQIPLEWRSQLP